MSNKKNINGQAHELLFVTAVALSTVSVPVLAFDLDVGNPDFSIRLDTTAKYTSGMRVEGRDKHIASAPNNDEGDYKFDRGELVMNRLDLLSEMDVIYRDQYGFRVSGAGWYDDGYKDPSVEQNPSLAARGWQSSYTKDSYSGNVKRYYRGPSGEILDAFVFANLSAGDTPIYLKAGQHTIYWGSATFDSFAQGINYGQAPQDARKAAAVPGTTAKEAFLPVNQLSFTSQLLPTFSIAGQYMLDWKPSRFPEGGTYFSGSDFLFSGPERFPLGPGFSVPHADALEPKDHHGSFGLSATWTPDYMKGGAVSAYYRKFDDPTPWLAPQILTSGGRPSAYRLVYPEDIKLFGLGVNMTVLGASVGADISMRKNAPLVASGVSLIDNEGPRGDTLHVILNAVKSLPNTRLWDTGTVIAELSYSHLLDVTEHEELFRGKGYAGCTNATRTGKGGVEDGCATENFWGVSTQFTPQWLQVFPGVDLSLPITARYGLSGNGATSLSGNEGAYAYSVGIAADFYQKYKAQLTYADSYADYNSINGVAVNGNGGYGTNDRGWVSLSLQTSF
ncbi:DUF1302 domain-containing protein [Pseudomonas sp. CG7]|uniref:DUF1302 domain-containing protein n=1 Tax=Pseudomonas sp. CG7 TaxID=191007 RepID=UPI00203439B8|nr:DUF1302 family protein [Pseudomonas sp. CG7]MCM2459322.1 DUF1302 domain-containing protein [Pseudomonas sp. CG7]